MKKIFTLLLALTAGVSSIFAQTCTDKGFVVVVLGSSTAAGWDGPTERDSAWVSILTRNFQFINANYRVINLAVAGTTTYAAQPSWYTPPNGRPVPDTAKNITKALIGYQADAVIVNFPTNDAINSYTLAEQQANFERIVASADSLHVPVWVTSTQPRTQMYGVSRQPLFDMRDWLLDRFRDRYIDFWSPFANADGSINTAYSHADGIHLNNTAHYIMAQRVFNEAIPDTMCAGPVRMPVFRGWYTSAGYADFLWHVTGQRAVKHYQLQYQSGSTWYGMTGNIPMQQQPNSWMNYTASGIGAYPVRLAITDTKNRVFYTGSIQVPDASEVLISRMQAKNESGKMFLEWATSSEYQLDTMGVEYNLAGQWVHLVSGINAKGSRYDTASYRVELPVGFGAGTYRLHYSSWAGSIKYTASRQVTIYKEPSAVTMTRTGVTRINDTRILWWETANERNIRAYRLLRQEGNSWVYVDSVRSLGNGTRSYTYTDRAFRPYAVNYMIQPVDIYDSLFAYSYANTGIDLNTQRPVYRNPQYTARREFDVQKVDFSVADARNIAALTLQRKTTGGWEHARTVAFDEWNGSYTLLDSVYSRLAIDYRMIITSPYDKRDTLPVFSLSADTARIVVSQLEGLWVMRAGSRQIMEWHNLREVNISAYLIQRRQPGSQAWTELSTIAATGSNSWYSFTDTTYIPGLAEYRLLVRDAFNVHSVSNRVILNPETGNAAAYGSYQLFRTGTTLAWNAYMEINVAQHQLQRKVGAENWSTIKTIAVAQESTGASTAYSFNDSTFEPREKSYRVLTTDNFGGEYISNIVEVPMDSSVSVADYKIIASNLIRSFDRQYLSWVTDGERNLVNMRVERFRDYGWEPVRTISPKGRGVYEVMDSLYYAGHISYRLLIDDRFGVTDTAFVLELGNDTSLNGYMEMGPLNVERQGKVQQLTWTSTKEFKIDCYEIRRIVNTGWEVVDTVTAVGSGNNYIYVDTIFRPDTVRYQVLAYDHTGSGYYSTPVLLEADTIYNSAFTTATPQVERQYDIQRLRITTWKERGLKNIIAEVRDDSAWKRLAIWPAAGSGQTYTFSDSVYRRPQTSYRWMAEDLDGKLLEGPQYVLAADTVKVERAEFTGGLVARKEHKQVITWTMGRSVMMANYSLQYSADSINWSTVPVAALSDEGSDKMYSITDSSYHPYTTYYRIKGLSQWSNIFYFSLSKLAADSGRAPAYNITGFAVQRTDTTQRVVWHSTQEANILRYMLTATVNGVTDTMVFVPAAGTGTDYTHIDTVYRAYSMLYRLYVEDLLGYTHFIGESQPGDDLNFMRFYSTAEVLRDSLVQVVRLTSTEEANVKFINIERLEAGEWKAVQQFSAQGVGYQYVYRDTIYRKDATTYRVRLMDIHNQHFGRDTLVLARDENYDQPFEMTSFAVARNGAAQQLNWNTSKEFRGDSMLVQRLQNGGWIQFAALPATGAGNYSYTDTTYRPGAVTYRIGMKDVDARVFYSDVQSLDADTNYTQPFVVKGFVVTRDSLTQQLAWNTGKEFRLRHIFVQRKVASGNWKSIDTLIAAGVPRSYAFTDASYSSQPTSYRLVGMDRDGRTFNSAQVDIAADANYAEPFVLSSFTAVRSNLQQQLNWRTSKEFRTKDFSIQRKEENGTWKEIGVKTAAGVPADYTFTDTAYTQLAVTYKLVMADKDARTFNSAEVSVAADPTYTETFKLGTLVVEQQKDKQILNWSTDNEWNIDSFYVERQIIPAANGRVSKDGWEIIAVLPAKGGSSTYAYVDVVAQDKQTAYRITALDKLGRDFTSQNVILTPDLSYRNAFNLKNFTLKAQSAARLLEWSTSSENGAASFEIERSTDSVAWKSIKTITATGNSDVAVNYSFIDEYNTGTIWVYYRLVMIDKDGARNLSNALKMVALITALPDDPQQSTGKVAAFPNPVSNSFKISGFANGVQVEVFNSLGVQVYYNKQYSGGEINASAWPAGMYYIVLNKGRYRLSLIKL